MPWMTASAVLMIVVMMVHAPCTTVDMVFHSPFQTVLMMVAAVWKMVWMFCIPACRSGVMVVMNVWMPVMIAVSAVMMMGPIAFQTFWRMVVMSVHPVCQICWIWLMVWVMNVPMACSAGWHAVLIWFQIPVNHVAKLFQSCLPVSVWVKNQVSAATTAVMPAMTRTNGFAARSPVNSPHVVRAAVATVLNVPTAVCTMPKLPAVAFNAGPMPPRSVARLTNPEMPFAAVVIPVALLLMPSNAAGNALKPADTALMPLLARMNAAIPLASGMMLSAWADT